MYNIPPDDSPGQEFGSIPLDDSPGQEYGSIALAGNQFDCNFQVQFVSVNCNMLPQNSNFGWEQNNVLPHAHVVLHDNQFGCNSLVHCEDGYILCLFDL